MESMVKIIDHSKINFKRVFFVAFLFNLIAIALSFPINAQESSSSTCQQVCAVAREEGLTEVADGVASGLCCCLIGDGGKQSYPLEQCNNLPD